ncbi:MAG: 30S ribosomal protein S10 [Clostridiales bacterium]|jgi:small subunit ribosomal protein S10|nr:30S ribosomal protein S10 [Clostridiales bacterium]
MATSVKKGDVKIRLKSYDSALIDETSRHIVEAAERTGATVSGPVPLPTHKEIITILRSTHINKDSREQFERRTHKRLIIIVSPTQKTIEILTKLDMPAGVSFEVQVQN